MYSCGKCPGLKLSSKGQRNKHNNLHKRGFLDPGGDVGVAKKSSACHKVGRSSDRDRFGGLGSDRKHKIR